jgi:hypothetical protein
MRKEFSLRGKSAAIIKTRQPPAHSQKNLMCLISRCSFFRTYLSLPFTISY